jgi:glucose-1-phosphate thymidylyltransferase
MEAIILCGGFATRLEPLTLFIPKPLLPIEGKPILDHIMDSLRGLEAKRVIISTNEKFEDQFRYWMSNNIARESGTPMELVVEPTTTNANKFGAIKGLDYLIKKLRVDDDVAIIAGDNYYSFDLKDAFESFGGRRAPLVLLRDVGSKEDAKRFGVVELEGQRVVRFEEKPQEPRTTMISTGIYMLPKDTLGKFDEYLRGGNNPDAPGYFLKWLASENPVYGFECKGEWFDIGTLDTYRSVFESHAKKR